MVAAIINEEEVDKRKPEAELAKEVAEVPIIQSPGAQEVIISTSIPIFGSLFLTRDSGMRCYSICFSRSDSLATKGPLPSNVALVISLEYSAPLCP